MNIFKKKSFFQLLLIGLMVTNSWSMNAEFKTKFVDSAEDVKKTDTKQSSTDAISSEPKELEVSMGQTTSYLRDIAETACLSKDGITLCPLTAVECKKDIELTDGLSKKVKKTIRKEKQSGLCTSDFKEDKNGCYKDYYYYNYSCSANEVGPLKKTGFDCSGDCGEFGCFCNPEKIEGNCEIVSNKCPINESLPCVNTLEGEGLEKPKTIYSAGSSKKTETEILGLKNCAGVLSNDKCLLAGKEITFTCDEGFKLKNNKCVKTHSWYEYSCPSGYEIGYKGNSSLDSKPTPPENNCLKVIEKKEKTYKYKRELKLKEMAPYGSISPKEFDFIRGFSHPENKIESITKIIGNSNTLTFFKGSKKYEIVVDNCLFTGEITADRLKGLIGNNTLKPVNGSGEIKSNCIINGFVGGPDRKEGIVAAKVVNNKLVFWDSFIDGDLGHLKFYTSVDNSFDLPTLGSIYNNGFTHYASVKKHSDMNGEKYKKHGLYITKVQGDKTLDAIKLTKFEERTGFDSFKCSTGCIDGMCSTATCKSGTYGVIRTKGEFIDEETCTNQTCDGYKKFNPYCGVELGSNCDTTKPGVFMKDGKCFEKACFSGKFNAETGKCE